VCAGAGVGVYLPEIQEPYSGTPYYLKINLKIFKNNSTSLKNAGGHVKKDCSFNKNLLI
jgi:hypothetical protein